MPSAVQPSIETLLPPRDTTPKASSQKGSAGSFEAELNKARPAPKPDDSKPAAKKTTRSAKPKPAERKGAKKTKCADHLPDEDDSTDTDAVADKSEDATSDNAEAGEQQATANQQAGKDVKAVPTDAATEEAQALSQNAKTKAKPTTPADAKKQDDSDDPVLDNEKPVAKRPAKTEKTTTDAVASAASANDAAGRLLKANQPTDDEDTSDDDQPVAAKGVNKTAVNATDSVSNALVAEQDATLQQTQTSPQVQTATSSADGDIQISQDIIDALDAIDSTPVDPVNAPPADPVHSTALHAEPDATSLIDIAPHVQANQTNTVAHTPAPEAPPAPPEARFAEANHPQIVTGIRGQLLPDGGTMHIRLDPPELGALQVSIHMHDGVMTASFQTSNDDATRMLSHSLAQLKHVLESQGVSVDKLHVSQAPRDQQAGSEDRSQQNPSDNPAARQEQQRRELIQRMWRRIRNGSDPLDMVA